MIKHITEKTIRRLQSFCLRNDVDLLVLFGSSVSGSSHAHSDVDLALQLVPDASISKLHLIATLEPIFDHRPVDLTMITNNTDPLLLFEIFCKGRLIFESTDGLFENSRLKAWHLYLDTKPLRQYEKAYNEARIRDLGHVT